MDIGVLRDCGTGVGELMGNVSWNNDDLASTCLNRLIAHNEGKPTCVDDEDLGIGMFVQRWAALRWCLGYEERYVDIEDLRNICANLRSVQGSKAR
jgi:hypothetical protein